MSSGWSIVLAAGPCVGCGGDPAGQDLAFYQVAASVLAVLLLTGVAGEIRDLRDRKSEDDTTGAEISRGYSVAVALVLSALLLGELLSLVVLLTQQATGFEQGAVSVCLAISVLGVPGLVVWAMWEERLRELRNWLLAVFALMAAALIGVGVYFLSASLTHSPAGGRDYHVYGTCASRQCGLNVRSRPDTHSRRLRQLHDGDEVSIECQTIGMEVPDQQGGSSIVWDRLETGGYVADVYVDTPPAGSEIDLCPNQAEGGAPRG